MSRRKLRILFAIFASIAYVGLFAPISYLLFRNWDVYFTKNEGALSVGLGGVLVLLTIVLLLKYGFKKFKPIFWSSILFVSVFCLQSIIVDLVAITFFVLIGVAWFTIFEIPMKHYKKLLSSYTDESVRTFARETTKEKSFGGRC